MKNSVWVGSLLTAVIWEALEGPLLYFVSLMSWAWRGTAGLERREPSSDWRTPLTLFQSQRGRVGSGCTQGTSQTPPKEHEDKKNVDEFFFFFLNLVKITQEWLFSTSKVWDLTYYPRVPSLPHRSGDIFPHLNACFSTNVTLSCFSFCALTSCQCCAVSACNLKAMRRGRRECSQ